MAIINFRTHKGRRLLNVIFSVGASIVIFGALSKLEHWGGILSYALTVGMLTETGVFLLMAFQPPEEEYYWEKVIPELNIHPSEKQPGQANGPGTLPWGNGQNPALGSMDKMLQEADITPASLQRLSENFQRLGSQVEKMADVADVIQVTGEYTEETRQTSLALQKMREAYSEAAGTVSSFTGAAKSTGDFHEQLSQMTKNLASLNAMYEVELQDTNNHVKTMNRFYGNLAAASESMAGSIDDTQRTQEQLAKLAENLHNLNAVYGNMLSAMHSR
jgi:gliding motility-associated protein GldL